MAGKRTLATTAAGAEDAGPVELPPEPVLCVVHPPALALKIPLVPQGAAEIEIGREILDHATVSRRHLGVRWDRAARTFWARDLGSRNGSRLDGADLGDTPAALSIGAVVRMGDVVLVVERASSRDGEGVSRDAVPGDASATRALRAAVERAARDPAPALLLGETGTGKEKIAGELHRLSGRKGKLVGINCASLSAQLVESQLFGHAKGAFTGAEAASQGLFRAADGGTLLLDEIGDLPLDLQPKLLRALEEREVLPVGSSTAVRVDVRVVAATHRNLAAEAERGTFRRDLYARLSLWELHVPPLRERRVDVLPWIERFSAKRGREVVALGPSAAEALLLFPWPSNLRAIDRLVHELAAVEGPVSRAQLPAWVTAPPAAVGSSAPAPAGAAVAAGKVPVPTREEFEREFHALGGSVHGLAKRFGRDRRQIYRWIEAYGLDGDT